MPQLTPQEWSRQANELQKQAGRPLDRATLEKELGKPSGKVTRGQSLEKGGSWKPRTGDRSGQSNRRARGERMYTTDAARANAAQIRAQAREQSQSTEHRYVHGDKPSIGEHAEGIASGGIGDDLDSVSDPIFKNFKDTVESKVRATYGDKYVVDINEVTGYLRVIPRKYYNQHQHRSNQPGFDVEPDMDIDLVVSGLPFVVAHELGMTNTRFPVYPAQPSVQSTAGGVSIKYKPNPLPGFDTSVQPGATVTAPSTPYTPPMVMEANGTNGSNGTNGEYDLVETTVDDTKGPPSNGHSGNGNGQEGFVQMAKMLEIARNARLLYQAGKAIYVVVGK